MVRQSCNSVSVRFMDEAVADFFDGCVDQGRMPEQFGRIWCHTHPGASPLPSWTDEETFARCFGSCHWSVMFILSRTSKTYARAAFGILPGFHAEIPVRVDWKAWPEVIDDQDDVERLAGWGQEYDESVDIDPEPPTAMLAKGSDLRNDLQVLAPLDFHLEPF